jgi:shikimate dehydrogenase
MFPNMGESAIDISTFPNLTGVADVVYNPLRSKLVCDAIKRGILACGGLYMLVAQAAFAAQRFVGISVAKEKIDRIFGDLFSSKENIVLVGMPGSGKSTVGKALAEQLGRPFIDTDEEIVKRAGVDIPTLFKEKGEPYFRELESEVIKDVCRGTGRVIATGGGAVKDISNRYPLRSNGKIFYIDRKVELLASSGRPLSKSKEDALRLYEERKDKYLAFADVRIDNNGDLENAVKGVMNNL